MQWYLDESAQDNYDRYSVDIVGPTSVSTSNSTYTITSYNNSDLLRWMAIQTPSVSLMGLKGGDAGLTNVRNSGHCPSSLLYEHCMVTSLPSSDEAPRPFWSPDWIHLQVGHWYSTACPHGRVWEWDHFSRQLASFDLLFWVRAKVWVDWKVKQCTFRQMIWPSSGTRSSW